MPQKTGVCVRQFRCLVGNCKRDVQSLPSRTRNWVTRNERRPQFNSSCAPSSGDKQKSETMQYVCVKLRCWMHSCVRSHHHFSMFRWTWRFAAARWSKKSPNEIREYVCMIRWTHNHIAAAWRPLFGIEWNKKPLEFFVRTETAWLCECVWAARNDDERWSLCHE